MRDDLVYGSSVQAALMRGAEQFAAAVRVTFGPGGRNVLLQRTGGIPRLTRDGAAVAQHVKLDDLTENLGARLLGEAGLRTAERAGDGSTTATVLAYALLQGGARLIAAGVDPNHLREGITLAVSLVVRNLELLAVPMADRDHFRSAAKEYQESAPEETLGGLASAIGITDLPRSLADFHVSIDAPLPGDFWVTGQRTGIASTELARLAEAAMIAATRRLAAIQALVPVSRDLILGIATVSAESAIIGELIANAVEHVGRNGLIQVQASHETTPTLRLVDGVQLLSGYLSHYFVGDTEEGADPATAVLNEAYVLLCGEPITSVQHLLPLLESVARSGKALLVIAEDIQGEALSTLVTNHLRKTLKVCAVRAPAGEDRREWMEDLATVTGGCVFSREKGLSLASAALAKLGTAERVEVGAESTLLLNGGGEEADIQTRVRQVTGAMRNSSSEQERQRRREQLARLTGRVAVIHAGAITKGEASERKLSIQSAVYAIRAAIEEGIAPGGGVALLRAQKVLRHVRLDNRDANLGVKLVERALEEPLRQIARNAGSEGGAVVSRVRDHEERTFGFNAKLHRYEDLLSAGVIDSVKVTRMALQNAASVASMMLSTEVIVSQHA